MSVYVALLRAVNVGGVKLLMSDLKATCEAAGFRDVRTFIASGNAVFVSDDDPASVKVALEAGLTAHLGAPVAVFVRDAAEMAAVVARNPFADAPGNRVAAIFLEAAPPADALATVTGRAEDEALALGANEIYVRYGVAGMGRSKLKIPAARHGTARNMNTVATLARMAAMPGSKAGD